MARARERHRNSLQLARQWLLLRILLGGSHSVLELARRLETSKSTVERDLATLEQIFPLVEEDDGTQRRLYRIEALRFREVR